MTSMRAARISAVGAAVQVAVIYAVVAALWILFSDRAVEILVTDREAMTRASMLKGWLFVAVTAAMLYFLVRRLQERLIDSLQREHAAELERLGALRLLETIAESSEDAIFAKDAEGRYTLFNRAAGRFVGKEPAAVLGHDDDAIFPPEEAAMLKALGREVMETNALATREEYLTTSDGERVFLATKGPLHDGSGRVVGIFGISRDITERKAAEERLQRSESHFRALVEQTLAGVYVIQDGRFRYVNPAFANIFGYPSAEVLIDSVAVSELVSVGDRERVVASIESRLSGGNASIQYTFVGLRRDGSPVDLEVHGRTITIEGLPAIIGMIIDVTARVAAEAEAQRNLVELQRFNRATVGRELDMIELKRVINSLSRELGREPPYPLEFLKNP